MRIRSFHMNGFGIFVDQNVEGLADGVNLFLGNNEAGKSTTLGFFRTMLFGYPAANNKAEIKYTAFRGGAEGGGLLLETDSMGTLRLQRKPGTHGGPVTLTTADGKSLQPDLLDKLLGGVTRELFRTVYGFSLTELQNLDSLDEEKVRHVLHSASFGAGSRPVGEVLKDCNKSLDDLFKPRASKPVINTLLKEISEVRSELRTLTAGTAAYDEKLARAEELEARLAALRTHIESTHAELGLSRRKLAQWERWTALQEAENLLAGESPVISTFPADALTRLDALQREIAERKQHTGKAQASLRQLTDQLDQSRPDAALLQQAAAIQAVVESKTAYAENLRGLTTFTNRKQDLRGKLDHLLATLGPDWTPERVQAFDLSLFTRERIDRFGTALSDAKAACNDARRVLTLALAADAEAASQEKQARDALEALPDSTKAPDENAASRIIAGRDRMEGIVRNLPTAEQTIQTETLRLKNAVADISPVWTPEALHTFDTSVPARQHAGQLADAFGSAEAEYTGKLQQHDSARTTAGRLHERYNERKAALDSLPSHATAEGLKERRTLLRRLREALHKADMAEAAHTALAERLAALPALNPVAMTCGVISLVAAAALPVCWHIAPQVLAPLAALLPSIQAVYAITALLAACGSCLTLSARPKRDPHLEQLLGDASATLEKARANTNTIADELHLPETTREAVDEAEAELEYLRTLVEERNARQREADTARRELNEAVKMETQVQEAVATAQERLESARNAWANYLSDNNLPDTVSPSSIGDIFSRVTATCELAERLDAQRQALKHDTAALDEYLAIARSLSGLEELQPQADLPARIDSWIEESRRQEHTRRQHAEAKRLLDERIQAKERSRQRHNEAEAAAKAADQACQQILSQWREWLKERGLDTSVMPETARVALDAITEATRVIHELEALRRREQAVSEQIQAVLQSLENICAATGRAWHKDEAAQAINGLATALEQAKSAATRQEQLSCALPEAERNAKEAEQLLAHAQARYAELLSAAQAHDEESFRARAEAYNRQENLRQSIAQLTAQLQAATIDILPKSGTGNDRTGIANGISASPENEHSQQYNSELVDVHRVGADGIESGMAEIGIESQAVTRKDKPDGQMQTDSLASLKAMFEETTRDKLEARTQSLEQDLTGLRNEEETLRTDLHEIKAALRSLETSDQTAQLLTRRESLTETLRRNARQWTTLALARHFVEQAKNTFEQERQPAVIKAAAEFLQIITDGAYTHIQTSLEDSSIRAVTAKGDVRLPHELSRGTAEQLYLALRLGYISNHAAHGEPLPVIMDDILVNFDPHRAASTARAFARLAQRNQVLFFTCHPATAEMMQEQAQNTALFAVKDGTITAQPV
ncbi:AAA family ATPase [Oleidesulfovibrio sp.]|uniref:AAA family ATPase n=1 Tax=Oleidesulfovibrio sp. TaxID=2909707 RepID=UPI003A884353